MRIENPVLAAHPTPLHPPVPRDTPLPHPHPCLVLQNLVMDRVCSVNLGLNETVCANITQPAFSAEEDRVQTVANRLVLYKNVSDDCRAARDVGMTWRQGRRMQG